MEVLESTENESLQSSKIMLDLNVRLEKYLTVLKTAETEGNNSKVRRYKRIVKQYKDAIVLCKMGKPVPLDELPNPPGFEPLVKSNIESTQPSEFLNPEASNLPHGDLLPKPQSRNPSPNPIKRIPNSPLPVNKNTEEKLEFGESNPVDDSVINVSVIVNDQTLDETPQEISGEMNILEELKSRLEVYNSVLKSAKDEGNASKARRYNRIIKQYSEAIALHKAGKSVPLDELPSPPGFPPLIPIKSEPPSTIPARNDIVNINVDEEKTNNDFTPDFTQNEPSTSYEENLVIQSTKVSKIEKQTAILKERQKEYKDAALASKRTGDIEKAKEYLKLCKGFDRLIQASESGLPVDLTTLPVSLKDQKETEDNYQEAQNITFGQFDNSELYANLEKELMDQIKMCMNTRNHFKMNGDIANANHFEQYALQFKKDLNFVKVSHSRNHPVPKFHYENKTFSTIKSNTDLTDNELELTIMQGINYKVSNPNDVDTYVMYEFPYPTSSPPSGRTSTVKNTNNPVYNTRVVFPINREASACQRVFKRHGIKMEVWSKGGFFHRDSSLGTVVVKLMPLAKEIKIHEAFDLMNGRRPAGGKLEVKVRIRDPVAGKKVETVSEKWLIIDHN